MVCEFCVLFAQESRMNKLLTALIVFCLPVSSFADIYSCDSTVWASTLGLLIGEEADWQEGYILDTSANTFRQVKEDGERVINPETIPMTCTEGPLIPMQNGTQRISTILCVDENQDRIFRINTRLGDLPFAYTKMNYGGARLAYGTCSRI